MVAILQRLDLVYAHVGLDRVVSHLRNSATQFELGNGARRHSDNDLHQEDFRFMQSRTLVEYRQGFRFLISGPR